MYTRFVRPLLFLLPPETAHDTTVRLLQLAMRIPGVPTVLHRLFALRSPRLARTVFGLRFSNPVGLAAGFDKDARLVDAMATLGFGFVEIGTVTPRPQPGNLKPRLFRLPPDKGLINRLGFNNHGAAAAAARLAQRKSTILVGGNIGKNKLTPNEHAVDDYAQGFRTLYPVVDYFTVNVSSPNTPDLRALQDKEPLTQLLRQLQQLNQQKPRPKPILLKIAPDLNETQLDDIVDICLSLGIDGIIATNTTVARSPLLTDAARVAAIGAGGLSGQALRQRSTEVIRYLHQRSEGKIPIVGVGGIHSPQDALEKLAAGASLVQLYTGYVYEGPGLVKRINNAVLEQTDSTA